MAVCLILHNSLFSSQQLDSPDCSVCLLCLFTLQLKLPPGQSIWPVPPVGFIKAFHNINLSLDSLSHLCIPNPHPPHPTLPCYVVSVGLCIGVEGKAYPVASGSRQCMGNYRFALNAVGHRPPAATSRGENTRDEEIM